MPSGQRQSYDDCVAGVGLGIILAPSTAAAQLALSAVVSDQRQPTDAEDLVIVTSDYRQPDDAEDLVIVPHLVQDKQSNDAEDLVIVPRDHHRALDLVPRAAIPAGHRHPHIIDLLPDGPDRQWPAGVPRWHHFVPPGEDPRTYHPPRIHVVIDNVPYSGFPGGVLIEEARMVEHTYSYRHEEGPARTIILSCRNPLTESEEYEQQVRFLCPGAPGQSHGSWFEDENDGTVHIEFNCRFDTNLDEDHWARRLHPCRLRRISDDVWEGTDDKGELVSLHTIKSWALYGYSTWQRCPNL